MEILTTNKFSIFLKLSSGKDERLVRDLLALEYEVLSIEEDLYSVKTDLLLVDDAFFENHYSDLLKAKDTTGINYLPLMV